MKRIILAAAAILLTVCASAAPVIIRSNIRSKTTFAIFTDSATWSKCSGELCAYRDAIEAEGLATCIVHSDWNSPDEVRSAVMDLAGKKPVLEGIVLVGDIPVAMVREGQHLTTAFKMNEKTYPKIESSVASDRFYDDFDLKFDFLGKDEEHEGIFYYRLSEEGAQSICSDIYSARIKVPAVMEGNKYEILRKYLRKVVKAHAEQDNQLDRLTYFAGAGYNSDCLTIWRQKPLAFREAFPYAFNRSSSNKFLNFREERQMKWNLFNEIQRRGTDLFIFSEHGAPDTQYISPSGIATDFGESLDYLKRQLAKYYRKYKGTDEDEEFCKAELDSAYHLPRSFFTDSLMQDYRTRDALEYADANIVCNEILKLRSNAKVLVFNACYNGSFHNAEGYVAGCHIFGDGDAIAAQGNTVNVLQDKWEDKLIGLLDAGERVGMWQKEFTFLESHLIGDPTFRFAPHDAQAAQRLATLHEDLVLRAGKKGVWKRYLTSDDPLMRSIGITHLAGIGNCSDIALKMFMEDSSPMVRIHALNALWGFADENAYKAAVKGFSDPYELVVRTSARMIASMCCDGFPEEAAAAAENNPDKVRARFQIENAENIYNGRMDASIKTFTDTTIAEAKRINAIRLFRNNRTPEAVPGLIAIAGDSSESTDIRVAACEALGWYNSALGRASTAEALKALLADEARAEKKNGGTMPAQVKAEIMKTIKRLQ